MIIGLIKKPYGILGWMKLNILTKENILNYKPWFIKKEKKYFYIKIENWIKKKKKEMIIKIIQIKNRTEAENLKKKEIITHKYNLQKIKKDEYFYEDIINCHVFTTKNIYIGLVINILSNKINNLLVIKKFKKKSKEIIIPFILNKIIMNVNKFKKKIIIKQF